MMDYFIWNVRPGIKDIQIKKERISTVEIRSFLMLENRMPEKHIQVKMPFICYLYSFQALIEISFISSLQMA
jgi:hypothetical protein